MITPTQVRLAEYIIDRSGIVDTLHGVRRTTGRGRPTDHDLARALWIGMFLSIHCHGKATLKDIHTLLTRDLSDTDKKRLKVRRNGVDINYSKLSSYSKSLKNKLSYGPSAGVIDDDERATRHDTILTAVNDLMDVFDLGWKSGWFAIDATGLWSWARGTGAFIPGNSIGDDDASPGDDDVAPASASTNTSADPDATWMLKTSKQGPPEAFFGYHGHAIVQVHGNDQQRNDEPLIVRRIEITTASADVVDVSLRLVDSLNSPVTDLLEDRHYNYKAWDRWHAPLNMRSVRQHFDLRSDQLGFVEYDRMRWAAGSAHCPATPDHMGAIARPPANAPKPAFKPFREAIAERQKYALYITERSKDGGTQRVQCPALCGTVGCSLRPGTVPAAIELGMPIVANPPDPTSPEGLPAICTQTKVSTTPIVKIRKAQQRYYWGSAKWEETYGKRTHIEGVFGNLKNKSTENLSRGLTRGMGLPWMNLAVAMTTASYNLRTLRKWHTETGRGPADHPLLQENIIPLGFEWTMPTDSALAPDDAEQAA